MAKNKRSPELPLHKVGWWRVAQEWSVRELAERAGVHPNTVRLIETHGSPFRTNITVALKLAAAFNCKVYELFDETELSGLGRPSQESCDSSFNLSFTHGDGTRYNIRVESSRPEQKSPRCGDCNLELPRMGGECQFCN